MTVQDIQLELHKYLPFFQPQPELPAAIALYNGFGREYLFVSSEATPASEQELQTLREAIDWNTSKVAAYQQIPGHGHIYFAELILGAEECKYWLVGFLPTADRLSVEQQRNNLATLQHMTSCLKTDFDLQQSLAGMADELAVRYEELNLLYGMDDSEAFYNTYDEASALRHIINNCTDYLSIDYAAIFIKDQEFFYAKTHWGQNQHNLPLIENIIRQQLFSLINAAPETLVINRNSEKDWVNTELYLPYKLIVAPIAKSNQKAGGLFVLLNAMTKADFTNSDRKLVEVLAAESSKLIQARRDTVTGQLNRLGLQEHISHTLQLQKLTAAQHCFLMLDIDQFKAINDTVGQCGGDVLLRQITAILQKNIKKNDLLGRIGSDEFGIILHDCVLQNAVHIADRIRTLIKQFRFLYQGKMFDISACVSLTQLDHDFAEFSQVINAAELACSIAKAKGINQSHVYSKSDQLTQKHENMMQWISRINIALEENRFQLYRQKIQALQAQFAQEEHYEVLIRLKNEEGEILAPFHFLPAAERFSLMPKIDQWVIRHTFEKIAKIYADNPASQAIFAINLSGQSFCEDGFIAFIRQQLKISGIPGHSVCFEVTETAAISNLDFALQFMEDVKKMGFKFSLDDFGSGMSSFTYLKNLPVDYLKIDGYFVKSLVENKIDRAMVEAIHHLGNVMGLKTIAEFVENAEIMSELTLMGVDYGQGYGIGKPEPF